MCKLLLLFILILLSGSGYYAAEVFSFKSTQTNAAYSSSSKQSKFVSANSSFRSNNTNIEIEGAPISKIVSFNVFNESENTHTVINEASNAEQNTSSQNSIKMELTKLSSLQNNTKKKPSFSNRKNPTKNSTKYNSVGVPRNKSFNSGKQMKSSTLKPSSLQSESIITNLPNIKANYINGTESLSNISKISSTTPYKIESVPADQQTLVSVTNPPSIDYTSNFFKEMSSTIKSAYQTSVPRQKATRRSKKYRYSVPRIKQAQALDKEYIATTSETYLNSNQSLRNRLSEIEKIYTSGETTTTRSQINSESVPTMTEHIPTGNYVKPPNTSLSGIQKQTIEEATTNLENFTESSINFSSNPTTENISFTNQESEKNEVTVTVSPSRVAEELQLTSSKPVVLLDTPKQQIYVPIAVETNEEITVTTTTTSEASITTATPATTIRTPTIPTTTLPTPTIRVTTIPTPTISTPTIPTPTIPATTLPTPTIPATTVPATTTEASITTTSNADDSNKVTKNDTTTTMNTMEDIITPVTEGKITTVTALVTTFKPTTEATLPTTTPEITNTTTMRTPLSEGAAKAKNINYNHVHSHPITSLIQPTTLPDPHIVNSTSENMSLYTQPSTTPVFNQTTKTIPKSLPQRGTFHHCVPTVPRLNLDLHKMLGEWYPAKISTTTSKLWIQSFKQDHNISNIGCLSMDYSMPIDDMPDTLYVSLHSANESTRVEAIFVGDDKHPKESKWAISWPNGEDTLTSVVAAGVIGKERNRYTWLLTVDCDLNGIVEPDWAVMARIPEGISNSTLTTILAIVEGLKGLIVEDAITYQSDDCHK